MFLRYPFCVTGLFPMTGCLFFFFLLFFFVCFFFVFFSFTESIVFNANRADPDQTQLSAASDFGSSLFANAPFMGR